MGALDAEAPVGHHLRAARFPVDSQGARAGERLDAVVEIQPLQRHPLGIVDVAVKQGRLQQQGRVISPDGQAPNPVQGDGRRLILSGRACHGAGGTAVRRGGSPPPREIIHAVLLQLQDAVRHGGSRIQGLPEGRRIVGTPVCQRAERLRPENLSVHTSPRLFLPMRINAPAPARSGVQGRERFVPHGYFPLFFIHTR